VGPVRFHDLRHTYGSMKIDQGENIYDVQRWMGHSSIQVTIDIYGHPLTDRGQEAAAKTDAVLFGLTDAQAAAAAKTQ
jgi:integrase